jgi:hypothetical protein
VPLEPYMLLLLWQSLIPLLALAYIIRNQNLQCPLNQLRVLWKSGPICDVSGLLQTWNINMLLAPTLATIII